MVRSIETTTNGRVAGARLARGAGYAFLLLPVLLHAEDLYFFLFVPEPKEAECLASASGCGFEWLTKLRDVMK